MLLVLLAPGRAAAENFVFDWTDGDAFVERSHREITIDLAGKPQNAPPELSTVEDSEIEWRVRRGEKAYRITRTCKKETRMMNGVAAPDDPAKKLYVDHPTFLTLDAEGQFVRADMDDIMGEAARLFPKLPRSQIEAVFSPARLEENERLSWWREVGRFVGRPVKEGDRWEDRRKLNPAPGMPRETFVMTVVTKVEPSPDRLLVTLFVFESSDTDLLDRLSSVTPQDLDSPEINDFLEWNIASLSLAKRAMRIVVDARTMRRQEAESIAVQITDTPQGLRTQTEHETLAYQVAGEAAVKFRLE